jgi:hypothetical protein
MGGIPYTTNNVRSFKKTKPSVLLRIAINHKFSNSLGIRLTGAWHKLSQFKLKSIENPESLTEIQLKNCASVGLGVFYSFN